MRDIEFKKFMKIAERIMQERGPLTLFALLEREGAFGWDLIISAPWIEDSLLSDLRYIADKTKGVLSGKEMTGIALMVTLRPDNEDVQGILQRHAALRQNAAGTSGGGVESVDAWVLGDFMLNGMEILRGYILVANGRSGPLEKLSTRAVAESGFRFRGGHVA